MLPSIGYARKLILFDVNERCFVQGFVAKEEAVLIKAGAQMLSGSGSIRSIWFLQVARVLATAEPAIRGMNRRSANRARAIFRVDLHAILAVMRGSRIFPLASRRGILVFNCGNNIARLKNNIKGHADGDDGDCNQGGDAFSGIGTADGALDASDHQGKADEGAEKRDDQGYFKAAAFFPWPKLQDHK